MNFVRKEPFSTSHLEKLEKLENIGFKCLACLMLRRWNGTEMGGDVNIELKPQ